MRHERNRPLDQTAPASPLAKVAAFAAVYIIWGSTYLAIRVGVETLPPFLLAALRHLTAGAPLYLWARLQGAPRPRAVHWRAAAVVGGFLLLGGNGLVTWSEQYVPSGIAAVLVAAVPFWMTLFDGFLFGGPRPTGFVVLGLACGFLGVLLLVSPSRSAVGAVEPTGAAALLAASILWAFGSLHSRNARLPRSASLGTSMQMLAGGAGLLAASAAAGEWRRFDLSAVSTESVLALLYLVFFGSLIGFSAYVWLLRRCSPALVSTYAFVNPVVAVFLGWAILDEEIGGRTAVAASLVVGAVAAIQWARYRARSIAVREGMAERSTS